MSETGEAFIRRTASFIRANAHALSGGPGPAHTRNQSWFSSPPARRTFAIDPSHLFYLLVQFDALGISVGDLDRTIHSPARPMSRLIGLPDIAETQSLAESVFSTVSSLTPSTMGSWFSSPRTLESELKFIYSSFTKLPALEITPPSKPVIADFALDDHAVPLHVFKNLQRLSTTSLDPRSLIAWPPFLRSLTLSDSGRDDVIDLLPRECTLLRHLSLSNNALTTLASIPLSSLVSLDLSSNLLVSVPSVLGELYNLSSLSLADNMIDSVLGIYTHLGNITTLNLSSNRLESICGLERLMALERVDLRHNLISDSGEISRLAVLPNISAVFASSNPFCTMVDNYRVLCFDYFWKEGKTITLDGTAPTWSEKRGLSPRPDGPMSPSKTAPMIFPPLNDQDAPGENKQTTTTTTTGAANPATANVQRKKKKHKRIVQLDDQIAEEDEFDGNHHTVEPTDASTAANFLQVVDDAHNGEDDDAITPTATHPSPPRHGGHARHRTEVISSSFNRDHSQPSFTPISAPKPRRQNTAPSLPNSPSFGYKSPSFTSSASSKSSNGASPRSSVILSPPEGVPIRPSAYRSATMASRSSQRAARVSASMFEPAPSRERMEADGEALRKKIEALKKEMGDGWLGVFSQSQVT